jgi:hypothetical protein
MGKESWKPYYSNYCFHVTEIFFLAVGIALKLNFLVLLQFVRIKRLI